MLFSQVDDRVDEHSGAWGEPSVNSTMATTDSDDCGGRSLPSCFRRTVSETYLKLSTLPHPRTQSVPLCLRNYPVGVAAFLSAHPLFDMPLPLALPLQWPPPDEIMQFGRRRKVRNGAWKETFWTGQICVQPLIRRQIIASKSSFHGKGRNRVTMAI